jgi:hypothetical protein
VLLGCEPVAAHDRTGHQHEREPPPTIEMSVATLGVAVLVVALSGFGLVSQSGLQAWPKASCGPWCVVMIAAMIFQLPLYTGRTGHQMGTTLNDRVETPTMSPGRPSFRTGG